MSRIMVVDDEATITTQLEERLTQMGYKVVGNASSGEDAVVLAGKKKPDLILMDIVMPGKLDGIDAAGLIKKELNIPVVFLTAYGDDKYIKRAKDVEPLGYIIKPYQENGLKAAIEIALYNDNISKKLKESEKDWRLLTENIDEGIILADGEGHIFFWNKGAENVFGYTAEEAAGKPLTFMMSEGTDTKYQEGIQDMISLRRSAIRGKWIEIVGVKKDWSRFPLELSIMPWTIRGNTCFIGITRDITRRKKLESQMKTSLKEKDLFLKEVQNKVKNNLNLIYNLLSLQTDNVKDRHALSPSEKRRDRIKSITLMTEKLSTYTDKARIDLANYIRNLTDRLVRSYGINPELIDLKVNTEQVYLDIKTAISCGLIISELVSNALKYAFPKGQKGKIVLIIHQENDNRYSVEVSDNGIGFPKDLDYRNPASAGMQIVNDLVAQLNGTLRLDRRGGTTFKITF